MNLLVHSFTESGVSCYPYNFKVVMTIHGGLLSLQQLQCDVKISYFQ